MKWDLQKMKIYRENIISKEIRMWVLSPDKI